MYTQGFTQDLGGGGNSGPISQAVLLSSLYGSLGGVEACLLAHFDFYGL